MTELPKQGQIFEGRYEILEVLGTGGYGTVFKARQLDAQRLLALKVIHGRISEEDPEFSARFMREAQILSKLSHRNIVTIYHAGISGTGLPYLAMELVEGTNLRKVINGPTCIASVRALKIIHDTADALSFMHQNGIVHRDLKPDNIILVDTPEPDTVKLIDFGLAKELGIEQTQKLTQTGTLIGSALYMSPEQCMGKKADLRSDVYSLSVCLFELLSGHRPYDADTAMGVMYKHMNETVPRIELSERKEITEALNKLLSKGMAKSPQDRFQSMEQLSQEIFKVLQEFDSAITRVNSTNLKQLTLLLGVLVLFLGTAALTLPIFRMQKNSSPIQSITKKSIRAKLESLSYIDSVKRRRRGEHLLANGSTYVMSRACRIISPTDFGFPMFTHGDTEATRQIVFDQKEGYVSQVSIDKSDGIDWHVQIALGRLSLDNGKTYKFKCLVKTDSKRTIRVYVSADAGGRQSVGLDKNLEIDSGKWIEMREEFVAKGSVKGLADVGFCLGSKTGKIWFSDLSLNAVSSRTLSENDQQQLGQAEEKCSAAMAAQVNNQSNEAELFEEAIRTVISCLDNLDQDNDRICGLEAEYLSHLTNMAANTKTKYSANPCDLLQAIAVKPTSQEPSGLAARLYELAGRLQYLNNNYYEAADYFANASAQFSHLQRQKDSKRTLFLARKSSLLCKSQQGPATFIYEWAQAVSLASEGKESEAAELARKTIIRGKKSLSPDFFRRETYIQKMATLFAELSDKDYVDACMYMAPKREDAISKGEVDKFLKGVSR